MKRKGWIVLGLISCAVLQGCTQISGPRTEDPTPTPIIVYQAGEQYFKASDLTSLGQILRDIRAGDPSPQPSVVGFIGAWLVPVPKPTFEGLADFNVGIEIRSECIVHGTFRDERGRLSEPRERSLAAIDCGCRYVEQYCDRFTEFETVDEFKCMLQAHDIAMEVFQGAECSL